MACKIGVAILFARGVQLDNGVISPRVQFIFIFEKILEVKVI